MVMMSWKRMSNFSTNSSLENALKIKALFEHAEKDVKFKVKYVLDFVLYA